MEFVKPAIQYAELWPLIAVLGVACLGVVVEAALPASDATTCRSPWPRPDWSLPWSARS